MKREIGPVIYRVSAASGINPQLIAAIIWQESRANQYAMRYEPAFFDKYIQNKKLTGFIPNFKNVSEATERMARATSFGPMQVMGATAREHGFEGTFLTELCNAQTGIEMGVKVLKAKLVKANDDINKALLLYNGGGNKDYPREVLAHIDSGEYQNVIVL